MPLKVLNRVVSLALSVIIKFKVSDAMSYNVFVY